MKSKLEKLSEKSKDLKPAAFPVLTWKVGQVADGLSQIRDYAVQEAASAIEWYQRNKRPLRRCGRLFRLCAILAGAVAGIIPVLAELYAHGGKPGISPLWSAIAVGAAALFVLIDKFYGCTSGWIRYIMAEQELQAALKGFYLDWEQEKLGWPKTEPTPEQAAAMVGRCRRFILRTHGIIADETKGWVAEFQSMLKQLDEAAKSAAQVSKLGAVTVVVTNGDQCAAGWQLSVDEGTARTCRGKESALGGIQPGIRVVKVTGKIRNQPKQAEKAVNVAGGEIVRTELTLT